MKFDKHLLSEVARRTISKIRRPEMQQKQAILHAINLYPDEFDGASRQEFHNNLRNMMPGIKKTLSNQVFKELSADPIVFKKRKGL